MTVKSIVTNVLCVFVVAPIVAALIVWGCWVLRPDPPPQTSTIQAAPTQISTARPAPLKPVSGRTVYMAHCARCHGVSGDGQGTEKLDRPARSFLAGGFSFGNTPEAVRRVVQHGIAGTPMPGFARNLNSAETRAVVEYVLDFAPALDAEQDGAALMVTDRPLVVRGMLPARGDWEGDQPRGVLLGGTDGLTLAYDVDQVRFRAARQGGFVNRTDWEGRGGTPLAPQGRVIHWAMPADVFTVDGSPVKAQFRGTSTQGGQATLEMEIPNAVIREHGAFIGRGNLSGYQRTLEIHGDASAVYMALPVQSAAAYLGESDHIEWWQDGPNLIGVRGDVVAEAQAVRLPADGVVELMVFPEASMADAAAAGIPVESPA